MNYRKKATLKAIRISKGVSGYYIVKHSWIWKINQYWTKQLETRDLVKFLILRGYSFSIEEFATTMFESGEYIPSERDIEKVQGAIKFQEKYGKTKL